MIYYMLYGFVFVSLFFVNYFLVYNNSQNNNNNNSMYRIPNRIFVGGIPQSVSILSRCSYYSKLSQRRRRTCFLLSLFLSVIFY